MNHGLPKMSRANLAVLRYAAEGLRNEEIAAELGISPSTVKDHLDKAYMALGARNRVHAVSLAYQTGLLLVPGCACPEKEGPPAVLARDISAPAVPSRGR